MESEHKDKEIDEEEKKKMCALEYNIKNKGETLITMHIKINLQIIKRIQMQKQ